jgi:hypothetical protein
MNDNDRIRQVFTELETYYSKELKMDPSHIFTPYEIGIETSKSTMGGLDEQTTIGGRKGFAKTTMGFWISIGQFGGIGNSIYTEFASKVLRNNFIYSADAKKVLEETREKYVSLPRYNPVQIDEGKVFYVRNFMKMENRELIIWMGSNRKQLDTDTGEVKGNKHMIICLDDFFALDSGIRASTNRHIEMITPGLGAMFKPLPIMTRDRWLLDFMMKMQFDTIFREDIHASDLLSVQRQINLYRRLPTFEGIVVCPTMDLLWGDQTHDKDGFPIMGPVEKEYILLDGQAKKSDKEKKLTDKLKDPWRLRQFKTVEWLRELRPDITWEQIATKLEVPITTLRNVPLGAKVAPVKPL